MPCTPSVISRKVLQGTEIVSDPRRPELRRFSRLFHRRRYIARHQRGSGLKLLELPAGRARGRSRGGIWHLYRQ